VPCHVQTFGITSLMAPVRANPIVAHGMDGISVLSRLRSGNQIFEKDAAGFQSGLRAFRQPLCQFTAAA